MREGEMETDIGRRVRDGTLPTGREKGPPVRE